MFASFKVGLICDSDGKTSKLANETYIQVFSAGKLGYIIEMISVLKTSNEPLVRMKSNFPRD